MISNFCIFSWSETGKTQSCLWARTVKYESNTEAICKWSAVHGLHEQRGVGLWGDGGSHYWREGKEIGMLFNKKAAMGENQPD